MSNALPDADQHEWHEIKLGQKTEVTIGRSETCTVRLLHLTISKVHAKIVRTEGGVEVIHLGNNSSTSVNGVDIRRARLKPGDSVRFGSAPAYRFTGTSLRVEAPGIGMSILLSEVVVEKSGRRLLDDINLKFDAGSFVALLGPSGAGKSVLLGCLATTIQPTSGLITFDDGERLEGSALLRYRSKLGIVPQDDLVYGALTVRENIKFAAELRVAGADRINLDRRIDSIMEDVGLTEHQSKQVRVLSGGQRKRIGVANELINRPRLLLLDEPTSGLDPGMQAKVMDMLRGLARQGITIVTSTHTMDTLHYFDSVVVLAPSKRGTVVVFQGIPSALLPAFGVRESADLFDKLITGDRATGPMGGAQDPPPSEPDAGPARFGAARPLTVLNEPTKRFQTMLQQAGVVYRRSWPLLRRDRGTLMLTVGQPLMLALLIVLSQSSTQIAKPTFIHFYLVVAAVWLGMTQSVREIVRDRVFYMRDRLAGLLPNAYLLGKVAFAAAITVMQATAIYVAMRLLILIPGLHNAQAIDGLTETPFFGAILVLIVAGFCGMFMGFIVSCLAASEAAAVSMLPLLVLPQILFSRVSNGDAGSKWNDPGTPYTMLVDLGKSLDSDKVHTIDRALLFTSLPMPSRPAAAVLDAWRLPEKTEIFGRLPEEIPETFENINQALLLEWTYLLALMVLFAAALYVVFRRQQARWRTVR